MLKRFAVCFALVVAALGPAWSGNGHMLHGMGPVNSSMGGAGAALLTEPIGALMYNPALMARANGNQIAFGTEFFEDGVRIVTTLDSDPDNPGVTNPSNQLGVLPSFGWMMHNPESKWSFGFGLIGIAGFRTDYPEDPASILFDTPPDGFGRIYTDYRVTKIPFALAYQVTPKLALGGSLNIYMGELAIAPLPHVDRDGTDPDFFYPQGGNLVNEFTYAVQAGFLYEMTPTLDLGGSVTTQQQYDEYTWNSTIADPESPNFGQHRPLDFDLDGPFMATVGAGWTPNDRVKVAFDTLYIRYEGVAGFGSPGGIIDRVVYPFGWRDVYVYKAGVEYSLNDRFTLRGGFNYNNNPLKGRVVLTATGAPSTFEQHYCAGVGVKLTDQVSADMGFYYVPRTHVRGPFPDLGNNVNGTLDTSNELKSVLVGLRWNL